MVSLGRVAGADAFERVVGRLDYPIYIATTSARGEPNGCLVGFATQCSIRPPRFLVCISDKNRTYRALEAGAAAIMGSASPTYENTVCTM